MKGFVLHFGKDNGGLSLPQLSAQVLTAKDTLRRHGVKAVLAGLFAAGAMVGAGCAGSIGSEAVKRLDMLFVTNISVRLDMNAAQIFISCFAAYFLFVFSAFLGGLSCWGFAAVPLLSAGRGFLTGLSCALLYALYRMTGVGFFILVVLPGTAMFFMLLVRYCADSFRMSLRYARLSLFRCEREPEMAAHVRMFFRRTLFALLGCGLCAVLDMALWVMFANRFDF